ncbi:alcohol oxidase [Gymnopus androsaceus JB14]|uniref:Alcohol oxidase n=1 Tax=Gymnopus androsaceus JB14 TaxID=1447944 RepID=A0A6A4I2T4_9AGAR|nr:alcohol oxidase [Gymnopus androsaceus JB14]
MWSIALTTILTLSFTSLLPTCLGLHFSEPFDAHSKRDLNNLRARNIVADSSSLKSSYDFIIVGGGLAGLALASRLSEDSNHTVLVLEAGETGDANITQINTPADTYYDSLVGSEYDYAYKTAEQAGCSNRNVSWPRGKVLGGSSAINGMYLVRPNELEVNALHTIMSNDTDDFWTWDSFYAAMKKSETFNAPSDAIATEAGIEYNAASHGSSGPIHWSYPGETFGLVGNWTPSLLTLGIPTNADSAGGDNTGAYIATSAINPSNWTRSYSRSGYIDPLPPRSNLDILASATVTNIVWDSTSSGNLTASGVQWASSSTSSTQTVNANKEVILAGGTIGSTQVLQLSGIGPAKYLEAAGVDVKLNLPGVGQRLQDHLSGSLIYTTNAETAGDMHNADDDSALFLSYINSATAYVNLTTLLGSGNASALISSAQGEYASSASSFLPLGDSTVAAGYQAIYDTITNFYSQNSGQVELLLSITSTEILLQAAIQHPLSVGELYITSNSVFDYPYINPNYLAHSADLTILREGFKLARQISQASPLSAYITAESAPGTSVTTDDEWNSWIEGAVGTEYHPTGTCAMLPLELGGVVSPSLLVYGTSNVRVADASVYPFEFSSHLGAPTYGLAEQAATIIRDYWNGVSVTANSTSSSSSSSPSTSKSADSTSNAAFRPSYGIGGLLCAAVACLAGSLML